MINLNVFYSFVGGSYWGEIEGYPIYIQGDTLDDLEETLNEQIDEYFGEELETWVCYQLIKVGA